MNKTIYTFFTILLVSCSGKQGEVKIDKPVKEVSILVLTDAQLKQAEFGRHYSRNTSRQNLRLSASNQVSP